jgi:hypothetical protein
LTLLACSRQKAARFSVGRELVPSVGACLALLVI